jgi:iron complex transport system substrate-binding protein
VKEVERIVSLAASNTEIVWALNLADRLVGVDDYSDFPPDVQQLPRVGRDLEIDADRVAALRPDLVLASLSVPGMERNLPRLEAAGLPYVAVRTAGWSGLWDNIRQVASAAGVDGRGESLIQSLQRRAARVAARVGDVADRPGVFWEWWPRPPIAAGGGSWITTMLQLAGGRNVLGGHDEESVTADEQEIWRLNPEVVVLCWCGAHKLPRVESVGERPGWSELRAVRDGRVHAVLEPLYGRPGPRLLDGLEELARLLHPERFA